MEMFNVLNIVIAKVWGGGEQYVYDTAKAMCRRGIRVYIAVDSSNLIMQQRFSEVAEVVTFNLYNFAGVFALKGLLCFIKNKKINIVNCHSGHAMHLCLAMKFLTGIKLVMFKHNALMAKHDVYHKWQRRNTDAFICVSKLVYDLQVNGLKNTEKEKYHLVYNGIDTEKFDKHKELKKEQNKFIIGYAGRIAEDKGIDILLQAFLILSKNNNDMYLKLAGHDEKSYLEKVQKFIINNNLQERVEYLGVLKDMEYFYKKLNLLVLPSVVREAFGLVICEAMYCGVPVITTDSGAQKEIITNSVDGLVVKTADLNELKKGILKMYHNASDVFDAKKAKEKIIKNFSAEQCANNIISVYNNLKG